MVLLGSFLLFSLLLLKLKFRAIGKVPNLKQFDFGVKFVLDDMIHLYLLHIFFICSSFNGCPNDVFFPILYDGVGGS